MVLGLASAYIIPAIVLPIAKERLLGLQDNPDGHIVRNCALREGPSRRSKKIDYLIQLNCPIIPVSARRPWPWR